MLNCSLQYPGKIAESELLSRMPDSTIVRDNKLSVSTRNAIYFGENLSLMQLLKEEWAQKIDLIYIDPPYGTGQDFADHNQKHAYTDPALSYEFLEFIRQRLILLREFLSPQGSIYIHIDKKVGHYIKVLADEVFGQENFINDISRIKCNPKNFSRKAFGNCSDMVLLYARTKDSQIWNQIREPLGEEEIVRLFPKIHPQKGRYTTHPLHAPGQTLNGDTGKAWKGMFPPQGRHWRYNRDVLDRLDEDGLIEWSETGNPRKIVFASEHNGKKVQDVWEFKDKGLSYVSYPTEKNHDLLARIIQHSSHPDSLIMDAFAGSGGTLWVAEVLGRNWIGIDQSPQSRKIIEEKLIREKIPCNRFSLQA